MSWRSALWAVFRLGLIASVALSSMSFSADDAEARRGGKVRSSKERSTSDDHSTKPKSDEQHDAHGADDASSGGMSVPRVRSREATRGSDDTVSDAADGMPSPRRHTPHARAVSVPVQDLDVPGCPTGMICTVCLAGCPSDIGGIVDAQAKTPIPVQEN